MGDQEVAVGQACLFCLQPLVGRVIGVTTSSRSYGSSHFVLHLDCFRRAFAEAAAPFSEADLDDMAAEWSDDAA